VAKRIGELLVEGGILSQSQLEQALFAQRKDGRKLGLLLMELGLVSEVQVTQTLSRQLSVPWVSLYHVEFSRSLLNLVPREIAEKYCLVPIFVRRERRLGETLYVAMDDPTIDGALEEVTRAAGLSVKPMIACPSDIRAAIRVYYLGESPAQPAVPALAVAPSPPPSAPAQPVAKPVAPPSPHPEPGAAAPPNEADVAAGSSEAVAEEEDGPETEPEVEAEERDVVAGARTKGKGKARMISLTLLDGTTISLPAPPKRPLDGGVGVGAGGEEPSAAEVLSDQLTARDLVSALRAVAHGADASEILGHTPRWEAMFAALLSIMLRKGLIADWEFVEEFRKV
jgi:type IV pilus assembly protein PilB